MVSACGPYDDPLNDAGDYRGSSTSSRVCWDAVDKAESIPWFHATNSELRNYPGDNLLPICQDGCPALLDYVNSREPGASAARRKELRVELDRIFDGANASAYHVIASWLDFKKHTRLASIVADRYAPTLDGHGLYRWCKEQAYWSKGEWRWQEQLKDRGVR